MHSEVAGGHEADVRVRRKDRRKKTKKVHLCSYTNVLFFSGSYRNRIAVTFPQSCP